MNLQILFWALTASFTLTAFAQQNNVQAKVVGICRLQIESTILHLSSEETELAQALPDGSTVRIQTLISQTQNGVIAPNSFALTVTNGSGKTETFRFPRNQRDTFTSGTVEGLQADCSLAYASI